MSQTTIKIENCNNIDSAEIKLTDNKLNIKFGSNGTGKSTIANAIAKGSDSNQNLDDLMPFKLRQDNPDTKTPSVIGIDSYSKVMFFNEAYVNQFTFKADELIENSFNIFIQTPSYKEKTIEIESIVSGIKNVFKEDESLEAFLTDLKSLASSFKLTKTGISKASPAMKGLASGNKIEHIPEGLESYAPFLKNNQNINWIDWQMKGQPFLDISDDCPFCTSNAVAKKEQIKRVSIEYDKNTIKHLTGLIDVLIKLGDYFSDDTRSKLDIIKTLKDGIEKEHEDFLVNVKNQLDNLIKELEGLKNLSAINFEKDEKVSEKLPLYKIDLTFFDSLNSEKTKDFVNTLNTSLDEVIDKAGKLQGQINMQRSETEKLIEKHQIEINQFLSNAGYNYLVAIENDNEHYRLILRHKDFSGNISGGDQHLSFGERNAFSLVLFMYECLSKDPSLIILDDPISSFDKNKKYAIMDMLFRQTVCLKGKTVLLLTHDVEPIIDTVKVLWRQFNNLVDASFLEHNNGNIAESQITKNDILTFSQICSRVLASTKNSLIKLVYLRRLYEVLDDKGDAYEVLSNLFHKRAAEEATDSRVISADDQPSLINQTDFNNGKAEIGNKLVGFNYDQELAKICDQNQIIDCYNNDCDNNYEKLQSFRILYDNHHSSVIKKFINESYHIENEFICQLDPSKYDIIPQYVINECDTYISEFSGGSSSA